MRYVALGLITLYWIVFSILLSPLIVGNPLISSGTNVTGNFNVSNFDSSEINSGGFFGGVIGIFTAGARFLGLALFGLGLPSGTPSFFQISFTLWQVFMSTVTILAIISIFWD